MTDLLNNANSQPSTIFNGVSGAAGAALALLSQAYRQSDFSGSESNAA